MYSVCLRSLLSSTAVLGLVLLSSAGVNATPTTTQAGAAKLPALGMKPSPADWIALNRQQDSPRITTTRAADVILVQTLSKSVILQPGNFKATTEQLIADKPDSTSVDAQSQEIDQMVRYGKEGTGTQDDSIGQVTSVSQLRDVQPTDWAFQALQSLVERYGCIAGYPDGTYRGNRAMTRYEFAAGLNACLNRVNELIQAGTADLVRKEDIATLQRLQQEFANELTALRGRVDNLEAQTAQLEANQFSTTTKLVGEGIFALTDEFNTPVNTNTVFQDRVRLDFQTSFTGKDTLNTRLAAGNATRLSYESPTIARSYNLPFGTFEGTQTFNESDTGNNAVYVDWLSYYFPVAKGQAVIEAFGGLWSDFTPTTNPYFEGYTGGTGSLSEFAQDNAIYHIGGGSGLGINIPFGQKGSILGQSSLTLGYLASNAARPLGNNGNPDTGGSGLFNGDYSALGQLNFNLLDRFAVGATYVHAYNSAGSGIFNFGAPENITVSRIGSPISGAPGVIGTVQANDPSVLLTGGLRPIVSNSYGGEFAIRPFKKLSISGWVDYTRATIIGRGNGDIWSYAAGIAIPDIGREGSIFGLFAGVEPTLTGLRARGATRFTNNSAWHAEGFYKYQLSDNISITPGVIILFDPGQNKNNQDAIIGTLRTTFTF